MGSPSRAGRTGGDRGHVRASRRRGAVDRPLSGAITPGHRHHADLAVGLRVPGRSQVARRRLRAAGAHPADPGARRQGLGRFPERCGLVLAVAGDQCATPPAAPALADGSELRIRVRGALRQARAAGQQRTQPGCDQCAAKQPLSDRHRLTSKSCPSRHFIRLGGGCGCGGRLFEWWNRKYFSRVW